MAPHPDRLPTARVVLLGDAGCGKTSLASLLAQGPGAAPQPPPLPTVGCDVFVRLLQLPDASGALKPHFVELWDVGGDAQHAALRPLFYSQVAGLILVHDLSRRRSTAGLARWAAELGASAGAGGGTGPCQRAMGSALQQRLSELGVHVPVLVVGTRADVADAAARRRGLAARAAAAVQRALCLGPRALPPLLPETIERRPGDRDAALFATASLRTASPVGRMDAAAVEAFFRNVLAAAPAHARTSSRGGSRDAARWAALLAAPLTEGEEAPRSAWEAQQEDPRGVALWEP